jgi:hypothetical protein
MKKSIVLVFTLLIASILISGCAKTESQTAAETDTYLTADIESEIAALEDLDAEIDLSELDGIDGELDEIDSLFG